MSNLKTPLNQILLLCEAQLKMLRDESDLPVKKLSEHFTELAHMTHQLFVLNNKSANPSIDNFLFEQLKLKIQESIVAFQFYDRMIQQINHVVEHIESANVLLEQEIDEQHHHLALAMSLIRKNYTMENQRVIFDAIINGKSVEDALSESKNQQKQDNSDIELF